MIREEPCAGNAFESMCERGMEKQDAEDEIARALLGCLWEAWRGYPDRFTEVMQELEEGKTTKELFPDALYESPTGPVVKPEP